MSRGPGPGTCCLPSSTDTAISGWPLISGLEFGPLPGAVPCARLHTRLVLREWQQISLVETAELVASELVTNAIAATRAIGSVCPVWLRLASDGSRTLVLVGDASPDPPRLIGPAGDTEGGRGLLLVEALSSGWGWYATRQAGIPHHHLAILAVRPDKQGQGTGTALLHAHHASLDTAGIPAYLEASDLRTRRLYLAHGYEDNGPPIHLAGGGLMYPMWRQRRDQQ